MPPGEPIKQPKASEGSRIENRFFLSKNTNESLFMCALRAQRPDREECINSGSLWFNHIPFFFPDLVTNDYIKLRNGIQDQWQV